jgi:hypothetical protein
MGAWGTAAFDNDDASDWVYDLEKRGMPAIESALTDALEARDLATPTDVNAIAAGEVIAAALGQPADGLREDIEELATGLAAAITPDHAVRARAAAERVLAGSEVADLWRETADDAAWQRTVDDLIDRLSA